QWRLTSNCVGAHRRVHGSQPGVRYSLNGLLSCVFQDRYPMPAGTTRMRKVIEVESGRSRYSAHEKMILLEENLPSPLRGIGLTLCVSWLYLYDGADSGESTRVAGKYYVPAEVLGSGSVSF